MPGTETKHKVRDVNVRMLRGGSGPPLLFLHGANGLPVWLPVFDLLSKQFEVFVPEHPGFGTSDNPPWMRNIGDLAMYYLDFLDGLEPASGPSGRPVARRLGRGRGRGAQLHAAKIAVAARRRPASASRACRAATTSSGTQRKSVRNLYHNQTIPDQMLAMQLTDEQADIMLTNRFAATKFGWEPRWYNPSLERWLHRITRADADRVGQGRTSCSRAPMRRAGASGSRAAASRSCPSAVTCRRSRSRRSPRRKSSACTRGHADAVHILPPDAVPPARHGRAPQASRRLGRAAEHAVRSEKGRRRIRVLHRPARLCGEARLRRDRGQRAPSDRLRHHAGAQPDRRHPDRAHDQGQDRHHRPGAAAGEQPGQHRGRVRDARQPVARAGSSPASCAASATNITRPASTRSSRTSATRRRTT